MKLYILLTFAIVGASAVPLRQDEIKIVDEINPEKGIHVHKEITPLKTTTTTTTLKPVLQREHEVLDGRIAGTELNVHQDILRHRPSPTSPLRERTKEVIDGKLPETDLHVHHEGFHLKPVVKDGRVVSPGRERTKEVIDGTLPGTNLHVHQETVSRRPGNVNPDVAQANEALSAIGGAIIGKSMDEKCFSGKVCTVFFTII